MAKAKTQKEIKAKFAEAAKARTKKVVKKPAVKKLDTIYCPVDLPQVGLRITIEGKQYTVTSKDTVRTKEGNEYKVIFK